jgi:hypothetical protein
MDVISRLAVALNHDDVEVALSITGPYGSGKSSLALMIDALFGPSDDPARASAEDVLRNAAPLALENLRSARRRLSADRHGFIRATVTAQREPVAATVLRALVHGAERFGPSAKEQAAHRKVLTQLRALRSAYQGEKRVRPEAREIRGAVTSLGQLAPILLLVDEFGKNLEAFADDPSEADLYLLQELAEWTRGQDGIPLALVTLQHMAFDEYASGTSAAQRREWAKIQGRFEDIPFVDSPTQTRALIAAAFTDPASELTSQLDRWSLAEAESLANAGLDDLAADPGLLARCWPLHPVALAVLPELCERYGQNERTLFSFLAGHEPLSVNNFLIETRWVEGRPLPAVHLERVYDYFLESAATMVAVSSAASRWLEIDTRVRDARGTDAAARRVLKSIGLLNLISAGGPLRASRSVICYAAADGRQGTSTAEEVKTQLTRLEKAGLLTFRDFADEYRVWQGSDFDLKAAIELARRRLRDEPAAKTVERVLPLSPLVAARHSQQKGTLRAFERHWVDASASLVRSLGSNDRADGSALYVLGSEAPTRAVERREDAKPVAFLTTDDAHAVVDAAREVAAIDAVLTSTDEVDRDWVAQRELVERRIEARAALDREFERAYGAASGSRCSWTFTKSSTRVRWISVDSASASMALSQVADLSYHLAPEINNDLVNRHDLSSQAAKARRELLEAMLANPDKEGLGITGFGPDRTLYLSVLREMGFHGRVGDGWGFTDPPLKSTVRPVWDHLVERLKAATTERARLSDIYDCLAAPPFGLRAGIAPILLVSALIANAEEIALYEHGTFRPVLTAEICERLLRNPGNFEVKHFASRSGHRAELLTAIANRLQIDVHRMPRNGRVESVLAVVSHLVALLNSLPGHVKRTSYLSPDSLAVRRELLTATEPDELLFVALPSALGKRVVSATGPYRPAEIVEIADRLATSTSELRSAYAALLCDVRRALREEFRGTTECLRESLSARAREVAGKVIDPKVARLVAALTADIPGEDEWAEYVAMNVTGAPPASWTDEDRRRFFSLIHDVGGTFRRIEALNSDLRSRGDGFDALRVTVTRPDGAEAAKLVWVDEARRSAVNPILESALQEARRYVGSDAEARDLLLAMLAERDLRAERPDAAIGAVASQAFYSESSTQTGL